MSHHFQQVGPANCIKGFGYIQLNKEGMNLPFIEILDHLVDIHEVVMYTPFPDEGSLVDRDQLI
jgi:hypothetical protein